MKITEKELQKIIGEELQKLNEFIWSDSQIKKVIPKTLVFHPTKELDYKKTSKNLYKAFKGKLSYKWFIETTDTFQGYTIPNKQAVKKVIQYLYGAISHELNEGVNEGGPGSGRPRAATPATDKDDERPTKNPFSKEFPELGHDQWEKKHGKKKVKEDFGSAMKQLPTFSSKEAKQVVDDGLRDWAKDLRKSQYRIIKDWMSKAKAGKIDYFDIIRGIQTGDASRAHPNETKFLHSLLNKDKIMNRFRSYFKGKKGKKGYRGPRLK